MSNVVSLGAHTRMTVEQALRLVEREQPLDVIVIATNHDGSLGFRTSSMDRKTALWMIENAKQFLLSGEVQTSS